MKKRMRFVKKATQSATPITTPQPSTEAVSSKWFRDIFELPLGKFEECLLNNNLSALVISGFPSPEELQSAWQTIIQEYSDSIGSVEHSIYLHLFKELELLKLDYESVKLLIGSLRKVYVPYFCDELNMLLRTNCNFNIQDVPSYYAQLDKCERRSKAMKIRLDLKVMEFEAVKNKMSGEGGKEIDKNYFTGVLIILGKHNGYRITKDIFVNEYCEYLKQFNKYCEEMNKQVKKK